MIVKLWNSENTMWLIMAILILGFFGMLMGSMNWSEQNSLKAEIACVQASDGTASAIETCKE